MLQNSQNRIPSNPSYFQRFFWFCSGVDVDLLTGKYPDYPSPLKSEFNKYIGVGTAVFFTSIFAAISASFALSFMEDSKWWICLIFGIIWGINIFFLDRYIVATMKKETNKWKEIFYALPRIFIGLVFAFTISVPIELSLFNGKIQYELSKTNTGSVLECEKICNEKIINLNKQIEALDNQVRVKQEEQPQGYQALLIQQKGIQTQINQLSGEISQNDKIINNNRLDNPNFPQSSASKFTYNETAKKYQYINRIKSGELNNQRSQFSKIVTEIQLKFKKFQDDLDKFIVQKEQQKIILLQELTSVKDQNSKDKTECQKVAKGNNDLLSRYDALSKAKGDTFSSIWWACMVLQLLFVFLELAPVLLKIIASKGSYDERIESIEAKEKLLVSEKNNVINEKLLDIQNDNEKSKENRDSYLEEERLKVATNFFEAQQIQDFEKLKIQEALAKSVKEQELSTLLKVQEISQKLEEVKANYNITVDTIKSGEVAEKQLQKKVADYIADKQFNHLKKEIDDFFNNQNNLIK
jgi:hypothetical protein